MALLTKSFLRNAFITKPATKTPSAVNAITFTSALPILCPHLIVKKITAPIKECDLITVKNNKYMYSKFNTL